MTDLITELHSLAQRMAAAGETDEPVTVSLAAEEIERLRAEVERLSNREAAMCDLEYANAAKRGFEWGQHDDNAALAACIESRVPEAVKELKELRHEVEMRKLQVTGAAKVIQEEKNDNSKLREERDHLKALLQDVNTTDYRFSVEQLATRDAEVIEQAALHACSVTGEDDLAVNFHSALMSYTNQLRQQAKEKANEA